MDWVINSLIIDFGLIHFTTYLIINLASLCAGFTNFLELLPIVLSQFVLGLSYINKSWDFSTLIFGCPSAVWSLSSKIRLLYSIFTCTLFLDLLCNLSLLVGWQGYTNNSIRFFISNLLLCFALFTTSLLVINTWYIFGTYILRCFVILVYPIKIPF